MPVEPPLDADKRTDLIGQGAKRCRLHFGVGEQTRVPTASTGEQIQYIQTEPHVMQFSLSTDIVLPLSQSTASTPHGSHAASAVFCRHDCLSQVAESEQLQISSLLVATFLPKLSLPTTLLKIFNEYFKYHRKHLLRHKQDVWKSRRRH